MANGTARLSQHIDCCAAQWPAAAAGALLHQLIIIVFGI
jgi:hypothetical protein